LIRSNVNLKLILTGKTLTALSPAHRRAILDYVEELENKLKIAHDIGEINTRALLSALNELEKIKDGKG